MPYTLKEVLSTLAYRAYPFLVFQSVAVVRWLAKPFLVFVAGNFDIKFVYSVGLDLACKLVRPRADYAQKRLVIFLCRVLKTHVQLSFLVS
jgi:branched-subunit amino acid transport protein AzlD